MKLWYSTTSPYVRKVLVTLKYQQLLDLKPFGTELNIGTLTAVAVIDWFLFRAEKIGLDLAKEFPNLTAWAAEMNEKYEVLRETKPTL